MFLWKVVVQRYCCKEEPPAAAAHLDKDNMKSKDMIPVNKEFKTNGTEADLLISCQTNIWTNFKAEKLQSLIIKQNNLRPSWKKFFHTHETVYS